MHRRRALRYSTYGGLALLAVGCSIRRIMKPDLAAQVRHDFERHVGQPVDLSLSPEEAISRMSAFLKSVRYATEGSTKYDDTLLFEYGVFDWGRGENFDLKITRQIVFGGAAPADADDHIVQISITHRYDPEPFRSFAIMTQWGCDLPATQGIAEFAASSPGYKLALQLKPREVTLYSATQ
jgi:hypothetical protein